MLNQRVWIILVQDFVSVDTSTCKKLPILHYLIVDIVRISLFDIKLLLALLALIYVDVAVLFPDHIVHSENLPRCLFLQLLLLS